MKIFTLVTAFIILFGLSVSAQINQEEYKEAVEFFNSANGLKQNYELDKAEKYYADAANLFKKDKRYTGNYIQCRYSVAEIYIQKNRFSEADKILTEIEKLSLGKEVIEKYGENNQILSNIYYGKGIVSAYNGKQDDAIRYYKKALKINDNSGKSNDFHKSNLFGVLGNAYSEKGDYEKALNNYKKDINIKKGLVGDNHPILAVAYNNIATIYKIKGEYDLALEHIEKAIKLIDNVPGKDIEKARFYSEKGKIYMEKGQYDLALEFYRKSLNINKDLLGVKNKSYIYNLIDLGILNNIQENYDKALIYFIDAYDIQIDMFGENHPDIALTCNNIGNVLRKQKKYESSVKYYEKAVAINIKYFGPNHPELAAYYNNMGLSYYNLKNYNSSMMFYLKASEIIENNYGSMFPRLVRIYANIGNICLKENKFYKSLYYYQKSIAANVKDFSPDSTDYYSHPVIKNYYDINNLLISLQGKADALYQLYISDQNIQNLKYSYENYILCDSAISIARKLVEKKSDKILLGNRSKKVYDDATEVAIGLYEETNNNKQKDEYYIMAFYFAENNKAVVLSEAVTSAEAKYFISLPKELQEREKFYKNEIAKYEKELLEIKEENNLKRCEDNLFMLNNLLRKLNSEIETNYPKYHELKYKAAKFSIKDIQDQIDFKTAVRSYFSGQDNIIIFTITKDGFELSHSVKPYDFDKRVKDFKNHISSGYESSFRLYKESAFNFYKLFFPEKVPDGIEKLIIIPDGSIGLIPFESLLIMNYEGSLTNFKEYPFLIKMYQINYAYSAGLLLKSLRTKPRRNDTRKAWLGFAPVFENIHQRNINDFNLTELPGSKEEINDIKEIFKRKNHITNSVINKSATETYFKTAKLKNYKYIHIATHGIVNTFEPKLSGLHMYPESGNNDGVLYSGEIYNLEMDADLAVLSACETGLGKISKSEGIIGLSRSLMYAGADNIIVSLWKVSDKSTTQLMVDFYTNLLNNEADRASALHKAKLKMITSGGDFAHPFFWSPFVLIGK